MDDVHNEGVTITQDMVAENLLWPLWRSITDEYKDRYKREIWEHFENALRSAAYTARLSTFLSNFSKRIPSELKVEGMKEIRTVIESGLDNDVLTWLREETTYLVMIVRLKNQNRKDLFKESQS